MVARLRHRPSLRPRSRHAAVRHEPWLVQGRGLRQGSVRQARRATRHTGGEQLTEDGFSDFPRAVPPTVPVGSAQNGPTFKTKLKRAAEIGILIGVKWLFAA